MRLLRITVCGERHFGQPCRGRVPDRYGAQLRSRVLWVRVRQRRTNRRFFFFGQTGRDKGDLPSVGLVNGDRCFFLRGRTVVV
jgi:hypothetical protein